MSHAGVETFLVMLWCAATSIITVTVCELVRVVIVSVLFATTTTIVGVGVGSLTMALIAASIVVTIMTGTVLATAIRG